MKEGTVGKLHFLPFFCFIYANYFIPSENFPFSVFFQFRTRDFQVLFRAENYVVEAEDVGQKEA
jgi:outer membrane receptor for Fe3+-dicitrate